MYVYNFRKNLFVIMFLMKFLWSGVLIMVIWYLVVSNFYRVMLMVILRLRFVFSLFNI